MYHRGQIQELLRSPFDVRSAWARFAPELTYGRHRSPPPPGAKHAAVLVLLYPGADGWRVPLITRAPGSNVHAGQVGFPGGQMEGSETPEEAALREFSEELGVVPSGLEWCGRLAPMYIYASDFMVTPCVAIADNRPDFRPNPHEVAELIEPELLRLADPTLADRQEIRRRGLVFHAPCIAYQEHRIWGATSMILAELLGRLSVGSAPVG